MEIKEKILTEQLEGNEAGTSTAMDQEQGIGLNNAPTPTPEEQANANIVNETSDLGTGQEPTSNPEQQLPNPGEQLPNPEPQPSENDLNENSNGGDGTEAGEEDGIAETSATEPTFTQSQVDEIAGKVRKETREKVTKDFFQRYGVNSAEELDNLFGDAQRFETIKGQYDEEKKAWNQVEQERAQQLNELKESVALLSSGIDKNRYEDAKFILRGKGLEVTAENIEAELATHPEWKALANEEPPHIAEAGGQQMPFRKVQQPTDASHIPQPATSINVLGNEAAPVSKGPELSDYEKAMKMFKV